MFTIVGYRGKSDQLITQPRAPDWVSVVCLMHDTHHKQLQWYQSDISNDKSCKSRKSAEPSQHKSSVLKREKIIQQVSEFWYFANESGYLL